VIIIAAPTCVLAATDGGVTKAVRTQLPNWQVGDIDKNLSLMCSLGKFNQLVPYRHAGHFYGPTGAALLGAAKGNGLNLFDPEKKANAQRDYWFHRDRTSACVVYSAPVRPGNGAPAATPVTQ
jgi:hypothetical protein